MTQRKILVFVLLLSAFAISFAIPTFDVLGEEKVPEVYDVSLIVRGKTGEQWESIKQGADQAASEMNVDLSFITLSEENNLPEQISLIQREYDSGVDAIVLAAADSNGLVSTVEQVSENIPVVCIESTVNSAAVKSYISADNYAMGVQLGQEIVRSGNARKRLAVVESSAQCSNVQQRRAGLMSVLGEIGGEVISWTLPDESSEAARTLAQELRPKSVDVVVTLDVTALEAAAQAVIDEQADYLTLFGIGSTGKVASYIEQDIVNATIVQNDFGIGYLGVKAAVDSLKKRPVAPATVVEHRMINWKTCTTGKPAAALPVYPLNRRPGGDPQEGGFRMNTLWKRTALLLSAALCLTLFSGGCSDSDDSQNPDLRQIKIGMTVYRQDDTFISTLSGYFLETAKARESRDKVKISVNVMDGKGNQGIQNDQVDKFLSQGYDVICVNEVDRTAASVIIDKAKSANIPIVFFNREPVEEDMQRWDRAYYVGAIASESGVLQGRIVSNLFNQNPELVDRNGDGKIQYVMLEGEPGHQDAAIRTEYSIKTVTGAGISVEKLANDTANWQRAQASAKMGQWLKDEEIGPRIEVVFSNNDDMALG
ncbi:MAG: substrate-binding domain-containing protein, partial [Anaerotruncus massiliensis (ex Togo et al. 2019)]